MMSRISTLIALRGRCPPRTTEVANSAISVRKASACSSGPILPRSLGSIMGALRSGGAFPSRGGAAALRKGRFNDPARITEYHAHVYYDPAANRDRAALVRKGIAARFPEARLGRWHDQPVGPHPQAMYQVAFAADLLPAILPWLMLNRQGLAVLV